MNNDSTRIGFVGLGRMGSRIARNLSKTGYAMTVFDIDTDACSQLSDCTATVGSLDELPRAVDVLILSLPGAPQVEDVVRQFVQAGIGGKTIIDLSTSYPDVSRNLYSEVTQSGGDFLDAPLSGGPAQAAEGRLNVMVGGDRRVCDRCLPVFESFSKNVFYVGGPGAGNVAKLANNYLSILYVALYGEIFPLVSKLNVDPNVILKVMMAGGPSSPMLEIAGRKIVDRKYDLSFSTDLAIKDLCYIKQLFEDRDIASVMLDSGMSLFEMAHRRGFGSDDLSKVAEITGSLFCSSEQDRSTSE